MPKYSKKNLKKNKNKNKNKSKKKSRELSEWIDAANNYRKVASNEENKLLTQVNKIVKLYA